MLMSWPKRKFCSNCLIREVLRAVAASSNDTSCRIFIFRDSSMCRKLSNMTIVKVQSSFHMVCRFSSGISATPMFNVSKNGRSNSSISLGPVRKEFSSAMGKMYLLSSILTFSWWTVLSMSTWRIAMFGQATCHVTANDSHLARKCISWISQWETEKVEWKSPIWLTSLYVGYVAMVTSNYWLMALAWLYHA